MIMLPKELRADMVTATFAPSDILGTAKNPTVALLVRFSNEINRNISFGSRK